MRYLLSTLGWQKDKDTVRPWRNKDLADSEQEAVHMLTWLIGKLMNAVKHSRIVETDKVAELCIEVWAVGDNEVSPLFDGEKKGC
jgi:hypothetical protein